MKVERDSGVEEVFFRFLPFGTGILVRPEPTPFFRIAFMLLCLSYVDGCAVSLFNAMRVPPIYEPWVRQSYRGFQVSSSGREDCMTTRTLGYLLGEELWVHDSFCQ